MKPVKTEHTDINFTLPGGTAENDLPSYVNETDKGGAVLCSVWQPSDEERERIAAGENIRLSVYHNRMPAVSIDLTDELVVE